MSVPVLKYIPYSSTELTYRLAEVVQDLVDTAAELAFVRSQELRAELSAVGDSVAATARMGRSLSMEHSCSVLELEGKREALQLEMRFLERLLDAGQS